MNWFRRNKPQTEANEQIPVAITEKTQLLLGKLYEAIEKGECGFNHHVSSWGYPESYHGNLAFENDAFGDWDVHADYDLKTKDKICVEFRIYEVKKTSDASSIEVKIKESENPLVRKIYELLKQKKQEKSIDALINSIKGLRDGDVDLNERQTAWAAARSLLITDEKQLGQIKEALSSVTPTDLPIMIVMPGFKENITEEPIIVTEENQDETRIKIDALVKDSKASHWLRYVYELFPLLKKG